LHATKVLQHRCYSNYMLIVKKSTLDYRIRLEYV
jgi:hypothetical protein